MDTKHAPGSAVISMSVYRTQLRYAGKYQKAARGTMVRLWKPSKKVQSLMQAAVFERDGYACAHCSSTEPNLHLDHILPYKAGGLFIEWNLQPLCASCNSRKGYKVDEDL